MKLAGEKSTWPGRKLVYRVGDYLEDVIQLDDEPAPGDATSLVAPAIRDGEIVTNFPSLQAIQARAARNLHALPERYRRLHDATPYPVCHSARLLELRERTATRVSG
jgi:nicotinate phosphoribosyltransferase